MATILQQQLAVINAKSTDQLNLKAQKTRHAQSLLFEPREAAGQSFDTIFQICREGFEELCQLDARFRPFAGNLFAEGSVRVEREHMTTKENGELDRVLEQYLGLVSGRLLLRPALKSVEWLLRRWKVHEYNTAAILFAFLPYHAHDIFPTLLSLLPKQLPPTFSFLRPYIAGLQCPPRHVLLSAAVWKSAFLTDFSSFVLRVAKRRCQSSAVIGFWASILAQAVNGMLDAAQSGRDTIRRERLEDVLLRVLPILQDTIAIPASPELFLGACMIMTILATKADLDNRVLDALMESIVAAWTRETVSDGVECLAVLAEEKDTLGISSKVATAIASNEAAVKTIVRLSGNLRVERLAIGVAVSCLDDVHPGADIKHAQAAALLLMDIQINPNYLGMTHHRISSAKESLASVRSQPEVQRLLEDLETLQRRVVFEEASTGDVEMTAVDELEATNEAVPTLEGSSKEQGQQRNSIDVDQLIAKLPKLSKKKFSFLDSDEEVQNLIDEYTICFEHCASSSDELQAFLSLPMLQSNNFVSTPEFLSVLAHVWSTAATKNVTKIKALEAASHTLAKVPDPSVVDLQGLLPYLLTALGHQSRSVRKAAAKLAISISEHYAVSEGKAKTSSKAISWGKDHLYGQQSPSARWLPTVDVQHLLKAAVDPFLEDVLLDSSFLSKSFSGYVNGSDLKADTRSQICQWLASHAALTNVRDVQVHIFGILSLVGKIGKEARKDVIIPFIEKYAEKNVEGVNALDQAVLRCVTHRTADELDTLKNVASNGRVNLASCAFHRIPTVFERLKTQDQLSLAQWLLEESLQPNPSANEVSEHASMASETLQNLEVPVEILASLFDYVIGTSALQDHERPMKRQRTTRSVTETKQVDAGRISTALIRATIILELTEAKLSSQEGRITVTQSNNADAYTHLLKALFQGLVELQHWRSNTGSDLTYLQTLILGNMLAAIEKLDLSTAKSLDRSFIRADIIVETLRSTSSPQVHSIALLVVSKIATFAPETVLHSVMPLFTFMSSSTLRQADAYSAHVIDMTIESIVPPLAASLRKRGRDLVAGASELLLSFTAAFEHIPIHRRLTTFTQLVKSLGPEEVLFAVVAMLMERYREDNTIEDTARDIMTAFDVHVQMKALQHYLELVLDACRRKRKLSDTILGFGEKNAAEANESVAALLEGFAKIVLNQALRRKVASVAGDATSVEIIRSDYGALLEQMVSLPSYKDSTVNFSEPKLKNAHDSALAALLGLLPTEEFISSSAILMQAGSEQVRCKVFASLATRVQEAKAGNTKMAQVFLHALSNCSVFISPTQPVSVRQAALECVDAICEKFGKRDRAAVKNVVQVVAGDAALESDDQTLRISALLCLASTVEVLGEEIIAFASSIFNNAINCVQITLESEIVSWRLVDAAFSFVNAVLDNQAWLLSAQDLDRFLVLAAQAHEMENGKSWAVGQFSTLAPRKVATSDFFPVLSHTLASALDIGAVAVNEVVQMLHATIKHHPKATINKNSESLFTVLLQAFDLRRQFNTGDDEEEADQLEVACNMVTQAALDMTLKLSDTTFRPFFTRMVDWATDGLPEGDEAGRTQRSTAFYEFAQKFFDQLGSIVTSYASFILDNVAETLNEPSDGTADEARQTLVQKILGTLSASFRHDQDDFWSTPQHFDAIAAPLLSLMRKSALIEVGEVVSVVANLASAVAGSPDHLKSMNAQIMTDMRHDDATVRLAAVKCERAITESLTFDWLNLLPEMLPFISELLEDDDESIEREVLRWVAQIEEVTGESLEGMLA